GGGLGMGSANSNGLISVRGSANLLTRTTGILAALFFATAIGLTILSELDRGTDSILNNAAQGGNTPTTVLDALQQMQAPSGGDLPVPATNPTTPATDAPAVDSSLPVPAATDAAPAATEAAPADGAAPAVEAPAAPTTEQPAAPAN